MVCYNCGRQIDGDSSKLLNYGENIGFQNTCNYCLKALSNKARTEIAACLKNIQSVTNRNCKNSVEAKTVSLNISRIEDCLRQISFPAM